MFRFGLADSDKCPRCNEAESLRHKFLECVYVRQIWRAATPLIHKLQDSVNPNDDPVKTIIAASPKSTVASMTLIAELLQNIQYLKPDQTYLLHPKFIVKRALKNLRIKEGNTKIRENFIEILNETNSD